MQIELTYQTLAGGLVAASTATAAFYKWGYPHFQKFTQYYKLKGAEEAKLELKKERDAFNKEKADVTQKATNLQIIKGLNHIKDVYRGMEEITRILPNSRVLLLQGHNCGGLPRPSALYYATSIMACGIASSEQSITYEDFRVDSHYINMLISILPDAEGNTEFFHIKDTKEMEPSVLKNVYLSENIKESYIHFVDFVGKSIYYISIARQKETPNWTPKQLLKAKIKLDEVVADFK